MKNDFGVDGAAPAGVIAPTAPTAPTAVAAVIHRPRACSHRLPLLEAKLVFVGVMDSSQVAVRFNVTSRRSCLVVVDVDVVLVLLLLAVREGLHCFFVVIRRKSVIAEIFLQRIHGGWRISHVDITHPKKSW